MKRIATGLALFAVLSVLAIKSRTIPLRSQESPAPDVNAAIAPITIVTSLSSVPAWPTAARPQAESRLLAPSTFSGPSYIVGPTITPTTTVPEAEEHIAVAPTSSASLVAAISDFSQRGGFNTTKYAVSNDGGTAWVENFVPETAGAPATADLQVWQANSDPVVAIDKLGNVYLADLYIDLNGPEGFYVCNAPLPSVAFTVSSCVPVFTNTSTTNTNIEDKEWIAVDNSTSVFSGTVYASWTHFSGCQPGAVLGLGNCTSDAIFFSRSTNHGLTWSAPIQISPASQNGNVQGSQVAVGPDGAVYVAYEVFSSTLFQGQHFIAKSTNGGISFSAVAAITPVFNNVNFSATYRTLGFNFPSLAASPVRSQGFVYDVYTDQPVANSQIECVRSVKAGGLVFTAPIAINDVSTGQHFMAAATVDTNGVLHTSFFDTRNSGASTELYDIYATFSSNQGSTFAPNARVTATQDSAGGTSFIGDYAGNAAAVGFAHPVWTSGGFNNGLLQTATLTLP